jgi:hypothetical protein
MYAVVPFGSKASEFGMFVVLPVAPNAGGDPETGTIAVAQF